MPGIAPLFLINSGIDIPLLDVWLKVSSNHPSEQSIKSNAHALARYAAIVQEAKMVPIVEPEVLMDGEHTIDKCFDVTSIVLKECYKELKIHLSLIHISEPTRPY